MFLVTYQLTEYLDFGKSYIMWPLTLVDSLTSLELRENGGGNISASARPLCNAHRSCKSDDSVLSIIVGFLCVGPLGKRKDQVFVGGGGYIGSSSRSSGKLLLLMYEEEAITSSWIVNKVGRLRKPTRLAVVTCSGFSSTGSAPSRMRT